MPRPATWPDDLRRYLDHRPIQARRPSLWMRARKMARRHRMAVTAVASVLLILGVAGTVIFTQQRRNQGLQRTERSRRYVEDIRAASLLVHRCRLGEARQILARYIPERGDEDIRSFPWFHLWKVCNYQPAVWPGHSDSAAKEIYHLELSPRGDILASSGQDGTVRLWDVETGRLLRTLRGHDGDVNWVAFSPDGSKLATGGDDGTVRLWSLSGSPYPITLGKHDNWVNCVLFTPDGRKLISGARDGRVKIWDVARGQMLASFLAQAQAVEGMALARDGRTLATCGGDGRIKLWDAESLRKISDLGAHFPSVQSVAFSHDGLRIAAGSLDGTVEVWDLASGHVVATGRVPVAGGQGGVQCVAFSPDDRTLASCGNDGAVRLWDPVSGDPLQSYRAEESRLWCVAFSRDGRTLMSSGADGLIRRWDLAHPQDRGIIRLPLIEVQSIAFPAESDRPLVAGLADVYGGRRLSISSWDLKRDVPIETRKVELARSVDQSRFSTDGTTLCTLDQSGQLTIWNTATGQVARKAPAPDGSIQQGWGPMSFNDVFITFEWRDLNRGGRWGRAVWRIGSEKLDFRVGRFIPLARLQGSERILVNGESGMVEWDPMTDLTRVTTIPRIDNLCNLSRSSDGRLLAAVWGYSIYLFNARTLRHEGTLFAHPSQVVDLDFSPDDKLLASVSDEGTVKLWDMTVRQELHTLLTVPPQDHDGYHLRFSADGSYLVCAVCQQASCMSKLIVWHAARPEDLGP